MKDESMKEAFEKWTKVNRTDLDLTAVTDADVTYLWEETEHAFDAFKAGAKAGLRRTLDRAEEAFFTTMEGIRTGVVVAVEDESTIRQSLRAAMKVGRDEIQ